MHRSCRKAIHPSVNCDLHLSVGLPVTSSTTAVYLVDGLQPDTVIGPLNVSSFSTPSINTLVSLRRYVQEGPHDFGAVGMQLGGDCKRLDRQLSGSEAFLHHHRYTAATAAVTPTAVTAAAMLACASKAVAVLDSSRNHSASYRAGRTNKIILEPESKRTDIKVAAIAVVESAL